MINLFEYLKTKALSTNPKDVAETDQERFGEPPMTISRAMSEFGINWRDIASKMRDWNEGKRRENIKACKDSKLIMYWKHCKDHSYEVCCQKCEEEANRRGWTFNKIKEH